ncbi:MAG: sensor histidine kinase [Spirochaetales bacterium]|nr:sensor histidine kinase [Spirochaetales bacterium]
MMESGILIFNRNVRKWVLFSMILLCDFAILFLFLLGRGKFDLPESWHIQFLAILGANLISSLVIFIIPVKGTHLAFIYIFQLGCKYLMTKPFSQNIWFEFFLLLIMMLEGIHLLSTAELTFLSLILMATSLLTDHNDTLWGMEPVPRTWELKLSLFILIILIAGLSIIIKTAYNLLLTHKEMINNQKLIIRKLTTANQGLQQYANLAEEKSIINERLKMTREIHDTVGYTLTNLLMMLEASTDLIKTDPVKLEKLLHQALGIIKTGHEDIRQALRVLRNTKMKKAGSIEAIKNLTDIFRESTGVEVRVEYGNLPRVLGRNVDHTIYRFLQEGMTNALTHGDAKNIDIHFWLNGNIIHINVEDDGKGSLNIEQGIGLKGMSERLSEVGGSLDYGNTFLGFSLSARIPWENDE